MCVRAAWVCANVPRTRVVRLLAEASVFASACGWVQLISDILFSCYKGNIVTIQSFGLCCSYYSWTKPYFN